MAEHARSTVETVVDDLSDNYKDSGGYRPVFNDTVRTVIYVGFSGRVHRRFGFHDVR